MEPKPFLRFICFMDDSQSGLTSKNSSAASRPGEEDSSLQQRYERLQLLYQVSNVIHSTLDPQQALELIMSEAVRVTRASSGSVILINPNTNFLEIQASHGLPARSSDLRLRVGEGLTGWVAKTGQPARVGNVRTDQRYIMLKQNICSELAVPLEVNGELRGVLNVDSDREDAFSVDDEKLLQELALQAAKVIHNTWLYEQLRQKARLFESLVTVGQTISSTLNMDEALNAITREACLLMNGKMSSLLMKDATDEWLELRASYGASAIYINKPRLSIDESLLGIVVRRKKPMQVENVQVSSLYQNIDVARKEGLVSLLSVPLMYNGKSIGALNIYTAEPHVFSNEEIKILAALAELSGIALEKARLYERIVDMEEQLRQNEKLSALGLLAAEVAHEIRNPLTVIKMLYHSLDLRFPPGDPRCRDVEVMGERMNHLNKIVEQILDFARTSDPVLVPVDVNHVLEDLALITRHKFRNQNVQLKLELDAKAGKALGDATQLGQVFLNLALNAVEAMQDGGTLTIKTEQPKSNGKSQKQAGERPMLKVSFVDTGHGMNPEQTKAVFASFLQTTKKRGTGIGLAIVSKIVETHQGTIEVKSKMNKGTTFCISLPIAPI
ncbi:MAG: GAF domain-containing protein [Verrucomicrobiales bacterium]